MQPTPQDLINDLPAWILLVATFCVPLLFESVRRNESLLLAVWFTLGLHHSAAITNCYYKMLPMADQDARTFDATARGVRGSYELLLNTPYVQFLKFLYDGLGSSHLLGCEISVLAFCFSLMIFIQLARWAGAERWLVYLVLLFGCLPSGVLCNSVTLREPFQTLFVLLSVYLLVRIQAGEYRFYLGLMLCVAVLTQLHNGLALFALGLGGLSLIWALRSRPIFALGLVFCFLVAGVFVGQRAIGYLAANSTATQALVSGDLLKLASSYRDTVPDDRTTYRVSLDTRSLLGFVASFPLVLIMYMFAPFPGMTPGLGPNDVYAIGEGMLRLLLCLGVLLNYRDTPREQRPRLLLMILFFLALESLWAVGTSNWGQAIRHRVVAWGLLVALGGGPLLERFFRPRRQRRWVTPD